eukprot:tig00020537_g10235.t1
MAAFAAGAVPVLSNVQEPSRAAGAQRLCTACPAERLGVKEFAGHGVVTAKSRPRFSVRPHRGFVAGPGAAFAAFDDAATPNATVIDFSPTGLDMYAGVSAESFGPEITERLMAPLNHLDVEIKPDGLIYLPEIKYRARLLEAFGPGGWALIPRHEARVEPSYDGKAMVLYREYALFAMGRFVSQAVGEQTYYPSSMTVGTAVEAAKSNALMRTCKDLGIAAELWDPGFILEWKRNYAVQCWVEHYKTGEKKRQWRRKDRPPFEGIWKEQAPASKASASSAPF